MTDPIDGRMAEDQPTVSLDQQLQRAELERRQAETAKYQAEKQQIDAERRHLEEEQHRPWYRRKYALQALGAGVLLGPFVWFYLTQVALPISRRGVIEAQLNVAELQDSLRAQAILQDSVRRAQTELATRLRDERDDLSAQNRTLSLVGDDLERQLRALSSTQTITQRERDSLATVLRRSGSSLSAQAWGLALTETLWAESVDEDLMDIKNVIRLDPAGRVVTISSSREMGRGQWNVSGDSLMIRIDGLPIERLAFALTNLDPNLPEGVILRGRHTSSSGDTAQRENVWMRKEN